MEFSFANIETNDKWLTFDITNTPVPTTIVIRRSDILALSTREDHIYIRADRIDDSNFLSFKCKDNNEANLCLKFLLNVI
jgi:hypothetical protein